MAESITPQDLENVKEDIEDIGRSSNERMIINPRYGAPYKSIPLLSEELQEAIESAAAAGAGANGWTDLLIKTEDGSTQRTKNTSFQSQINSKASTIYVDAQDANLQTQINGKASAEYLDVTLAEQTQTVNTALSQLSTLAAKFYPTLVEANADIANIAIDQPVQVGEAANGGLWYKATAEATTLTKSDYDPLTQAKEFVNTNPTFKRKTITTENIKSITVDGDYSQSNKANAVPANGYPSEIEANDAGFLNVKSIFNEAGTISVYRLLEWRPRTTGTIFFCSYIYATNSWTDWIRVSTSADLEELKSEILVDIGKVEAKIVKPYDIVTQSPNLFDKDSIQDNAYINNSGVIISSTGAAGWGMSDFIPVTAGEYYTISGTRGRHGVGFYSTKEQATSSALSYNGTTTLPLTVQAPAGANFMLINVYAASNPSYSNLQVEKGSVATTYMPYGNLYEINPAYINGMGSNSKNRLEINGNIAKVYGEINGKSAVETIQLTKANTHSQSTVLNMVETSIDGVIHRTMTDDVAPLRADNTTIGANHGYAKVTVTSSAHGKTTADIGSVWSDGTYEWVIIDIVSANQIAVTTRADNRSALASNNLTHVSGAVNTSGFTATASTAGQWYQAFKNRKLNVSVDGVPVNISEDGVHQFSKNVSFHESYEIMKKNDIVEWLIANKGQDYQYYNAESAILYSQSYSYDKEIGCTIYSSIVALRSIPFVDYMATQAIPFNSGGGDVLYTVPKSTNFGELVNITTDPPSATVNFTAGNLEAGATPVDRLIMLNNSAGFAVGYLPILSADPTERAPIGRYGEIRVSSDKWYPRVAYNSASVTMNAGDHYEVIAYRKPFLKSAERTASYAVRSTQGDYLYLNWHTAKRDVIQLPDDLVGREFEIVEKSSNVTLLSAFATNSIVCDVGSELPSGYLTLRFK